MSHSSKEIPTGSTPLSISPMVVVPAKVEMEMIVMTTKITKLFRARPRTATNKMMIKMEPLKNTT